MLAIRLSSPCGCPGAVRRAGPRSTDTCFMFSLRTMTSSCGWSGTQAAPRPSKPWGWRSRQLGKAQEHRAVHGNKTEWTLSGSLNLQPEGVTGWQVVRLTLIPGGTKSEFQTYNFYVDPYLRR